MAALSTHRNTIKRSGDQYVDPVKGTKVIWQGALVALDANGFLVPGATATGLKARGRAMETVNNAGGADGAVKAAVERGCFAYGNDGSVTRAHIGASAYIVDDQTVASTDGTGTRSIAGKIVDLDAAGVWIEF